MVDTIKVGRSANILHVVKALDDAAGSEVILKTSDRSQHGAGALVLVDSDVPQPGVGCYGHIDGGHREDDGELAGAGVRSDGVDDVLVVVDSTQGGHRAAAGHQEELLSTLSLGIWTGDLEHVQLQLNLTDVVVHPGDHQVAHGGGGGRVDPVGAVLVCVAVTDVLKMTADSEARGAGPHWFAALVMAVLLGVAGPVTVAGGETHSVGEPHHGEQTQEPTASVSGPVLYHVRPGGRNCALFTKHKVELPVQPVDHPIIIARF